MKRIIKGNKKNLLVEFILYYSTLLICHNTKYLYEINESSVFNELLIHRYTKFDWPYSNMLILANLTTCVASENFPCIQGMFIWVAFWSKRASGSKRKQLSYTVPYKSKLCSFYSCFL